MKSKLIDIIKLIKWEFTIQNAKKAKQKAEGEGGGAVIRAWAAGEHASVTSVLT